MVVKFSLSLESCLADTGYPELRPCTDTTIVQSSIEDNKHDGATLAYIYYVLRADAAQALDFLRAEKLDQNLELLRSSQVLDADSDRFYSGISSDVSEMIVVTAWTPGVSLSATQRETLARVLASLEGPTDAHEPGIWVWEGITTAVCVPWETAKPGQCGGFARTRYHDFTYPWPG